MTTDTVTRYRVYRAPEGIAGEYCGEFDDLADAEEFAATEPAGLEESLWETAAKAGHCGGLTAPPAGGVISEEPIGWYGSEGWHCVVAVHYSTA